MPVVLALLSLTSTRVETVRIPEFVARDVRIVDDSALIPLQSPPQKHGLFLASIDAAYNSGDTIAEGPYINAKTGEYVEPPGSKYEMIIRGELKVVAPVFGVEPFRHMPYRWKVREMRPDPEDAAYYSPFRSGGIALLGYDDAEAGARQFNPTYLLPTEWADDVAPAYQYVGKHASTFDVKTAPRHRTELRQLMASPNPVLGVFAARTLCGLGGDDWRYVRAHWNDGGGLQSAVDLLLVLRNAASTGASTLAVNLGKQASTSDVHVSRAVLLAGVGAIMDGSGSPGFDTGNKLLDTYKAAMVAAGHPYGDDAEIAGLLQFTGR